MLAGAGIFIGGVLADPSRDAPDWRLGGTQVLICLYGAGIFSLGWLLGTAPPVARASTLRLGAALYLAGCAFGLSLATPGTHATWVLLGYFVGICVLLPLPIGVLALVGVSGAHLLLTWISERKASLTGLPVTMLDIRIALAHPSGFWDALGYSDSTRHLLTFAIVATLGGWFAGLTVALVRLVVRRQRIGIAELALRSCVVGALSLALLMHVRGQFLAAEKDPSTWAPKRVSRLADRMGTLPFLAYSYRVESQATGVIYEADRDSPYPSVEEIRSAVLDYVEFGAGTDPESSMAPNIVAVLAESTFDPGVVLRLEGEWEDELFRAGERTAAIGPLRVNAFGGGTWITEFETIAGIDSRIFGYAGMYTHASLAPFVDRSFATYLRDRGYRNWAFFPNSGDFYNSRNAYRLYGFEHILDSQELAESTWMTDDVEMANRVKQAMGREPEAPFFAYVLLLENHSPHDCSLEDDAGFGARFADDTAFLPNCALAEYLRRLGSTTAAVRSLVDYLVGIEARTGRPFTLVVFGDHQPFSFSGVDPTYDYSPLRKTPDRYTTFFHVLSSVPGRRLRCCTIAPPATVLPTLLSTFVASSPDDVYMGLNLWLYARCGSDAVRRDFPSSMALPDDLPRRELAEACGDAYRRALAGYRRSGVVRLQ